MGCGASSLRMCPSLCAAGHQRVHHLAQPRGLSQSRVQRLRQAPERRSGLPAAARWDPAAGHSWCTRLGVATLSPCGLKRGGGLATLSAFGVRLRLQHPLGCAPMAWRGGMPADRNTILLVPNPR